MITQIQTIKHHEKRNQAILSIFSYTIYVYCVFGLIYQPLGRNDDDKGASYRRTRCTLPDCLLFFIQKTHDWQNGATRARQLQIQTTAGKQTMACLATIYFDRYNNICFSDFRTQLTTVKICYPGLCSPFINEYF